MAKVFKFENISAINFVDLPKEDLYKILEIRNDPRISKWMYNSNIVSLQIHLDFIKNLKSMPSNAYWLFKEQDTILGVGSLTRINITHKSATLGLYKNPELSRVGDKIIQGLEHIAFKAFGLHTLILEVIESNSRAINLYKRNNFCYAGCLKEFVYINKSYQDVILYQKINPSC